MLQEIRQYSPEGGGKGSTEFSPEDKDLNQTLWLPPWLSGHRNTTARTGLCSPNPSSSCTSRPLGSPRGVPPQPALRASLLSMDLCMPGRAKAAPPSAPLALQAELDSGRSWAAFSTHQSLAPSCSCASHLPLPKGLHVSPWLAACPDLLAACRKQRNEVFAQARVAGHMSGLSHCKHPLHHESRGLDTLCCFSESSLPCPVYLLIFFRAAQVAAPLLVVISEVMSCMLSC